MVAVLVYHIVPVLGPLDVEAVLVYHCFVIRELRLPVGDDVGDVFFTEDGYWCLAV